MNNSDQSYSARMAYQAQLTEARRAALWRALERARADGEGASETLQAIASYKERCERNGKRWDQLVFSAAVLVGAAWLGAMVGAMVAVWSAWLGR